MNKHTVQKLESSLHEALTARSDSKSFENFKKPSGLRHYLSILPSSSSYRHHFCQTVNQKRIFLRCSQPSNYFQLLLILRYVALAKETIETLRKADTNFSPRRSNMIGSRWVSLFINQSILCLCFRIMFSLYKKSEPISHDLCSGLKWPNIT